MFPIRIEVGELNLEGELNDTECGQALARALPLTAKFWVWGDSLQFDVALEGDSGGRSVGTVKVGDLGFLREEGMVCIFFGPTPLSPAEDPVSAVPVTVVGRIDRVEQLRSGKHAGEITVHPRNGQEP